VTDRRISIGNNADILEARKKGRELACDIGFSSVECALIATAISELARNIVLYAGRGEIRLNVVSKACEMGIVITARDKGPGISDIRSAMLTGFSTSKGGLGLGLPGLKRIMDEFEIISEVGVGTTVSAKKWKQQRPQ
jgi:serine/threonine-protein kinase RsbT